MQICTLTSLLLVFTFGVTDLPWTVTACQGEPGTLDFATVSYNVRKCDLSEVGKVGLYYFIFTQFKSLPSIDYFTLNGNEILDSDINAVQAQVPQLLMIPHLSLKSNSLTTIPVIITAVSLDLTSNAITYLDDRIITNMTNLEVLLLNDNDITSLHSVIDTTMIHPHPLVEIDLRRNSLTRVNLTFFAVLPNLLHLDMDMNPVQELSSNLYGHAKLEEIFLSDNQLQEIDLRTFTDLTALTHLLLSTSQATSIIPGVYDFLSLTTLNLDDNNFSVLNMSDFAKMPQLSILTLRNSSISHITPDVNSLLAVTILDLQNNQLTTISMSVFDHMTLLETLNLQHNNIHVIDEYCHDRFNTFGDGFRLYLDGNPLYCDSALVWIKECVFDMYVVTSPVCAGSCHTGDNFNDLTINDLNGCTEVGLKTTTSPEESTPSKTTQMHTTTQYTTLPHSIQPQTTQPETTLPKTTQRHTTQTQTTQLWTTQPETTLPQTIQRQTTQLQANQAETNQAEFTQPQTTQPEITQPQTTQLETILPDTTSQQTPQSWTVQAVTSPIHTTPQTNTHLETYQPETTQQASTQMEITSSEASIITIQPNEAKLLLLQVINNLTIDLISSAEKKLSLCLDIVDISTHSSSETAVLTLIMDDVSQYIATHIDEVDTRSELLKNLAEMASIIIKFTNDDWMSHAKNTSQVKRIMGSCENSLEIIASVINTKSKEKKTVFEFGSMVFDVTKLNASDIMPIVQISSVYGTVIYNTEKIDGQCLSLITIFAENKIHIWDPSANDISSPALITKKIYSECSMTFSERRKRSVENSADSPSTEVEINLSTTSDMYFVNETTSSPIVHHINLTTSTAYSPVCITIEPGYNQTLFVQLKLGTNKSDQVLYLEYELFWNESVGTGDFGYDGDLYYSKDNNRTMCIPAESLEGNNTQKVYVYVQRTDCVEVTQCVEETTYSYNIMEFACYIWNEGADKWTSDDCQVQTGSNPSSVKFKSNLFGSLAAGLFVAPNMIDFDTVFDNLDQKIIDNIAVVATVITIILMYVFLVVICRIIDRKDNKKWAVLPLDDNVMDDNYHYEVHVYTGFNVGAGTNSNVSIVLAGTECDSGVRNLATAGRKNFKRGEVSSFLMKTSYSVGIPLSIKIWHDNTDRSWLLDTVVIVDVHTRKWYMFKCGKWLSENISCEYHMNIPMSDDIHGTDSLFGANLRNALFNYHIWMSVGYRKTRSSFTRVQRLNCCLAAIFLLIVTNAMWYATEVKPEVAFKLGVFEVTVHQIYTGVMSSVIIVPLLMIIILIYDKSKAHVKEEFNYTKTTSAFFIEKILRKIQLGKLPYWFAYIAHVIVAVAVLVSGFITILYAFDWGKEKSLEWLGALVISLLQSVVCVAPVQVVCIALIYTFLFKTELSMSEYQSDLGNMQTWTEGCYPITKNHWKAPIAKRCNNDPHLHKQMMEMIYNVIWQIVILLMVLFIVYGNRDNSVFHQNKDLKDSLLKVEHEVIKKRHQKNDLLPIIQQKLETWYWLSHVVVPVVYPAVDYNNNPLTDYDKKFLTNGYAYKLGPPRLRQVRVLPIQCRNSNGIYTIPCRPQRVEGNENMANYTAHWKLNRTEDIVNNLALLASSQVSESVQEAFLYQSERLTGAGSSWGAIQSYPGGGYVADLGNSYGQALQILSDLESSTWIDDFTTAIILEINVWNPNTNFFNQIIICIEYRIGGGVQIWHDIAAVNLYRYVGAQGLLNLLVEIITTIIFLVKTVKEGIKICRQKEDYFRSLQNKVTLAVVFFYNTGVVLYVWRSALTSSTLEEAMNNKDKTINFQMLVMANRSFMACLGFVAFLLEMQLLNILNHITSIKVLATALRRSGVQLISNGLFLLVSSFAFVFFFTLMYGSNSFEYKSVISSSSTLLTGALGHFRFQRLAESTGRFGVMMFFVYNLLSLFIFLNILTTVLMVFVVTVKAEKIKGNASQVMRYMAEWIKKTFKSSNPTGIRRNSVNPYVVHDNNTESKVIELEKRVRTLENLVQLEFMNNEAHDDRVNNSVLPYYAVWNNFNRYQQGFMKKYDAISAKLY